jgi:hypothetical protein
MTDSWKDGHSEREKQLDRQTDELKNRPVDAQMDGWMVTRPNVTVFG